MEARWRIELLGGLRAWQADRVTSRFRTRKTASLLAYLAFYRERSHPRDLLIDLLWPEAGIEEGRHSLRQALSSLRRQFEPPGVPGGAVIRADRLQIQLNPAVVTTDVADFQAALRAAAGSTRELERRHHLMAAIEVYRGELLPGFYDDWCLPERERLAESHVTALRQLIESLVREGDVARALPYARRAVQAAPLREEPYLELMRLLAASGEAEAALREYRKLERLLDRELGEAPSARARQLTDEIRRGSRATAQNREAKAPLSLPVAAPDPDRPDRRAGPVMPSPAVPTGTVTFLMVGIDAGALQGQEESVLPEALQHASSTLRPLFRGHGGHEIAGGPEASEAVQELRFVFGRASDAVAAAVAGRRALLPRQKASATEGTEATERGQEPEGNEKAEPTSVELPQPSSSASSSVTSPGARPHAFGAPASVADPFDAGQTGWPLVRMALHAGEVDPGNSPRSSPALHEAERLLLGARGGQILVSEAIAVLSRGDLGEDLRLVDLGLYRPDLLGQPQRLLQIEDAQLAPREFPPPKLPPAYVGTLPPQFTRFFGRQEEMARLRELLLTPETRLVTLTGPGGTGKTRLAIEVAGSLAEAFGGAVWFAPLADVNDPDRITDLLLHALGLSPSPAAKPMDQVVALLSRQKTLLVLDNVEHLVDHGAPVVRILLERVASLVCLVTSRQSLGLSAERAFPLATLPTPRHTDSPERLLQYEGVQLFVDRAQAVRPDFQITPQNATAVATLCRRLEGIPLSIELAAVRVQVLTPSQILSQLDQRFRLLVSRRRDSAPRHRSLRDCILWSYDLLSPAARRLFPCLFVFRGGFTLEAAEAICGGMGVGGWGLGVREDPAPPTPNPHPPTPIEEWPVIDSVAELLVGSLVTTLEGDPEIRFCMLETMREYAEEECSPEQRAEVERRHAAFYLALAERADPELRSPRQQEWLACLAAEQENFRAALEWSLAEPERIESALRLVGALFWFWRLRGYWREGREWTESALDRFHDGSVERSAISVEKSEPSSTLNAQHSTLSLVPPHSQPGARYLPGCLRAAGILSWLTGDATAAQGQLEESIALGRELGDAGSTAASMSFLALIRQSQGDRAEARRLCEESIAFFRQLGDRWGLAVALTGMGTAIGPGDTARSLHEQSLALFRELGDRWGLGLVLTALGSNAMREGEYPKARSFYEESLRMRQEVGDRWHTALSLSILGYVTQCMGDPQQAASYYDESLTLHRELSNKRGIAGALRHLAELEQAAGDAPRAAIRYREALALYRELDDGPGMLLALIGRARQAAEAQQRERAARLLGAAEVLREAVGARLDAGERASYDRDWATIASVLGATERAAWGKGSTLTLEQALDEALREVCARPVSPP